MSLDSFMTALFEHGRVRVASPTPVSADELRAAEETLAGYEQDFRLEFPGTAPVYDPAAALWGATMFQRAAKFVVYRDLDAPLMTEALSKPCPVANSASTHYSVDLTFRFLPDLARLAKTASQNDPLLGHLRRWASEWPLSSVGMTGIEPASVDAIVNHQGLLTVYIDRILARSDRARLADPRVRAAAQQAVGAFPELAGELADEFQLESNST